MGMNLVRLVNMDWFLCSGDDIVQAGK
jgi:hypothetical protein